MGANTPEPFARRQPPQWEQLLEQRRSLVDVPMFDTLWTFDSDEPALAYADDGRVMLTEGDACIVLPAPAGALLTDILARKCAAS